MCFLEIKGRGCVGKLWKLRYVWCKIRVLGRALEEQLGKGLISKSTAFPTWCCSQFTQHYLLLSLQSASRDRLFCTEHDGDTTCRIWKSEKRKIVQSPLKNTSDLPFLCLSNAFISAFLIMQINLSKCQIASKCNTIVDARNARSFWDFVSFSSKNYSKLAAFALFVKVWSPILYFPA